MDENGNTRQAKPGDRVPPPPPPRPESSPSPTQAGGSASDDPWAGMTAGAPSAGPSPPTETPGQPSAPRP
eukprot:8955677-Lingulodinium_polyedra.AAC.1